MVEKTIGQRWREKVDLAKKHLQAGQEIKSRDLMRLETSSLVLVGNGSLNKRHFRLKEQDRYPFDYLPYPGKSAKFDYLEMHSGDITPEERLHLLKLISKKPCRRDKLWFTSLELLHEVNYRVYFAPVKHNPLHVRLVHESHITNTRLSSDDPPDYDRERLTRVWRKTHVR